MKATIIMGSPRRKSSASYRLARHFSAGLKRAGVETDEVMLADYKINHCIGCYTCWTKTPGECVHRDDMIKLLPKFQTDLMVFAVPLYVYGVPGKVKDFIDRQLPLLEPFLKEHNGVTSHPRRGGGKAPRLFLISAAGFPERSHFDALVATFRKMWGRKQYAGDILVGGAEPLSRDELQGAYKDLYELVEHTGFELGRHGKVTEATSRAIIEKTAIPSEQIETFRDVANIYWQSLQASPKEYKDLKIKPTGAKELRIGDGGMAAFMAGMAREYNPKAMPGLKAVLQFKLDDETYHLCIDSDSCKAYRGEYPEPTTTIICPKQLWMDISSGDVDGHSAFMKGEYRVEGDMTMLMKIDELFGSGEEQTASPLPRKGKEVPDHRGPIKLPGMRWLTVAFLPWMILWIMGSITGGWMPRIIAAGLSSIIILYHLFTNRPTLFEVGSTIYLIVTGAVHALGGNFFQLYATVLDYIFLGGLWLGSCINRFSLTGEYSRHTVPKAVWDHPAFTSTNTIISSAWGIYFLIAGVFALIMASGIGANWIWRVIIYSMLVPMFVFTGWFQKWYPERLIGRNG